MSTKAQHTPGPWRIENGSILSGANGLRVAEYREAPGLGHAAEANARLIAASPTLLSTLKELHSVAVMFRAAAYRAEPSLRISNEAVNMLSAFLLKAENIIKEAEKS